jgi:transcriptional regulator with XRE-family HTH domain
VLPESKVFFRRLGARVRQIRKGRGWSIDDMEVRGLRAKHWQQLETGRPITVETLLRICQALDVTLAFLVADLDAGIYKELPLPVPKKKDITSRKRRPKSDESLPDV